LLNKNTGNYPIIKRSDYYYQGKDAINSKVASIEKIKEKLNWQPRVGLMEGLMQSL